MMRLVVVICRKAYESMAQNLPLNRPIEAEVNIDDVTQRRASIQLRGDSSLYYPKKCFAIRLAGGSVAPSAVRQIDLSANYGDKSLIRERLSFELFDRCGSLTPKAWHTHLFIQSQDGNVLLQGVFTGLEHVDDGFFHRRGQDSGNLFSADGNFTNGQFAGAFLDGDDTERLIELYKELHSAEGATHALGLPVVEVSRTQNQRQRCETTKAVKNKYHDLAQFAHTINSISHEEAHIRLHHTLDMENVLNWLAVNTLIQNNDVYHKNYYLHHRPEDAKWEVIPWDLDFTFGRCWDRNLGELCSTYADDAPIETPLLMRNRLGERFLRNGYLRQQLVGRISELLETEFTEQSISQLIDQYYSEIAEAAYTDFMKWPTNREFALERSRLKTWIRKRRQYLGDAIRAMGELDRGYSPGNHRQGRQPLGTDLA